LNPIMYSAKLMIEHVFWFVKGEKERLDEKTKFNKGIIMTTKMSTIGMMYCVSRLI
jgi:hypothetical protein